MISFNERTENDQRNRIAPDDPHRPSRGLGAHRTGRAETGRMRKAHPGGTRNTPENRHEKNVFNILARHTLTLFNLLNLGIALALISVGAYRNLTFLLVVISNTIIGTFQEVRTWRAIKKMQLMAEGQIHVLRGGSWTRLRGGELVEGDVIRLGTGEQIPADSVVLDGQGAANESMLTGKAAPSSRRRASGF